MVFILVVFAIKKPAPGTRTASQIPEKPFFF